MTIRESLDVNGFVMALGVLAASDIAHVAAAVRPEAHSTGLLRRGGDTYAVRGLLWQSTTLPSLLENLGLDHVAREALGPAAVPVDATLFDKTPNANWTVPGHQDLVVPVAAEVDAPGFSGWSVRRGCVYVEPPLALLSRMVALRVHLDDCGVDNGALAVVPRSHLAGRWSDANLRRLELSAYHVCGAARGDVLLMRPLIVHRSSPSREPRNRRVLHVVYATEEPSDVVRWRPAGRTSPGTPAPA